MRNTISQKARQTGRGRQHKLRHPAIYYARLRDWLSACHHSAHSAAAERLGMLKLGPDDFMHDSSTANACKSSDTMYYMPMQDCWSGANHVKTCNVLMCIMHCNALQAMCIQMLCREFTAQQLCQAFGILLYNYAECFAATAQKKCNNKIMVQQQSAMRRINKHNSRKLTSTSLRGMNDWNICMHDR